MASDCEVESVSDLLCLFWTPLCVLPVVAVYYKSRVEQADGVGSVVIGNLCYNMSDVALSGDEAVSMIAAQSQLPMVHSTSLFRQNILILFLIWIMLAYLHENVLYF